MKYLSSIFSALILLNIFVWYWSITGAPSAALNIYFFDVGQGDSTLTVLPGGVKILTDGGPDKSVLSGIGKTLSPIDRYIDLVILSHPEVDHFIGLISVLERYRVGAFVWNGRERDNDSWRELQAALKSKDVPVIVLGDNDKIIYKGSELKIISPDGKLAESSKLNNASLVALLSSGGIKTLFTGDIGFEVENKLVNEHNLDIDVLKVPHHGSKHSSSSAFLNETTPLLSVIQVGKNRYGHPAKETLARLTQVGSSIYRNDEWGLIHLVALNGKLNVFKRK